MVVLMMMVVLMSGEKMMGKMYWRRYQTSTTYAGIFWKPLAL